MARASLPEGFRWTWAGDTVRVDLPRIVKTAEHAYEPVLSRGDAEALADALAAEEGRRRVGPQRGSAARPLARIVLAHSPSYSAATLAGFRAKLAIALIERGPKVAIDEMETLSGDDVDSGPGAA